jgi:hypothetical protein
MQMRRVKLWANERQPHIWYGPAIIRYRKEAVSQRVIARANKPGMLQVITDVWQHRLIVSLWLAELKFEWKTKGDA